MQNTNLLTIRSDRQDIALDIRTILYINIGENIAEIHTSGGKIYKTRMTLEKLESKLGGRLSQAPSQQAGVGDGHS